MAPTWVVSEPFTNNVFIPTRAMNGRKPLLDGERSKSKTEWVVQGLCSLEQARQPFPECGWEENSPTVRVSHRLPRESTLSLLFKHWVLAPVEELSWMDRTDALEQFLCSHHTVSMWPRRSQTLSYSRGLRELGSSYLPNFRQF